MKAELLNANSNDTDSLKCLVQNMGVAAFCEELNEHPYLAVLDEIDDIDPGQ